MSVKQRPAIAEHLQGSTALAGQKVQRQHGAACAAAGNRLSVRQHGLPVRRALWRRRVRHLQQLFPQGAVRPRPAAVHMVHVSIHPLC